MIKLALPVVPRQEKQALSAGLQNSLQNLFPRYNLTAKTWAALTRERETAPTSRSRTPTSPRTAPAGSSAAAAAISSSFLPIW